MLNRRLIAATSLIALSALAACEQKKPVPPPEPSTQEAPLAACPPGQSQQAEPQLAALTAKAQQAGAVRVIVRLADNVTPQAIPAAQTAAVRTFTSAGANEVTLLSPRLPYIVAEVNSEQLRTMYADPQFAEWSEDKLAFPTLAQSAPLIQAPQVWALGGRGAGQAVAILDTGVDRTHPFLAGRVVAEACFSTASAANGSTSVCPNGQAAQTGAGAAAPCAPSGCEHGTHVAGIAAGKGPDFSGVAPDADVIAVQVFSRFTGAACGGVSPCVASFTSDQIRALDFILQQAGQRPVASANMSLGGGRSTTACDNDLTKPVIDQLRAAGVAVAIASGNEGFRDSVSFPSCISSAVTVGATSKQDQLADFSNCGPQVDLHAPGVGINSSVPGNRFASLSGTSMATPHVAGAFASLKSLHPTASVDAIEAALKSTGLDVGGRPRIRLLEANTALRAPPAQEVAVSSAQDPAQPAPPAAVQPAMTQLAALPPDSSVRVIVGVPTAAQPQSVTDALARVEAAARAYGAAKIERLGSQPLLAIECTAKQAHDLAASGAVASMQVDKVAKTQN